MQQQKPRQSCPKLMLCYISLSLSLLHTLGLSLCLCVCVLIKYACSLNFFNLKPLAVKFCGLVRRLIKVAWQQSCPQLNFYFYTHLPAYTHTHTHLTHLTHLATPTPTAINLPSFASDNFILI